MIKKKNECKRITIIKNKFISTLIGTASVYLGIAFIMPLTIFAVYITSYINIKQNFVTMHYGIFLGLIFAFSMSFSTSLGTMLENLIGFYFTIFLGLAIDLVTNIFFFRVQNIWLCYILSIIMGIGAGIAISLLAKNLTLYKPTKKGIISSFIGLITIVFSAVFAVIGEKIINNNAYTFNDEDEVYPPECAERTYKYFMLGFFTISISAILVILFIYEYKPEYNNNITKNEILEENRNEKLENNSINENENISNNVIKEKEKFISLDDKNDNENEFKKKEIKNHVKKVIKTMRFWRFSLISFFIKFTISFMINTGRTFGAIIGINGHALQFLMIFQVISIIMVGPIIGILVDKKGPLFIIKIVSITCIIPGILLGFFMENTIIFCLSFIIDALGLVGSMVSFGPFIMEIYGIQECVILLGIINAFSKISEAISTIIAFIVSFFYDNKEIKKPYRIIYFASSISCAFSFALLYFESKEKFDYKDPLEEINKSKDLLEIIKE